MAAEEQIFREFLETYNRIVEECFNRCVYTFNYRYLLDDEIDCASRCTFRYVNYNQRMAMNFATMQAKKMIDMQEQTDAQQQQQQQQQQEPLSTMNTQVNDNSRPS